MLTTMSIKNTYLLSVLDDLKKKSAHEPEFLQAAEEVLESLEPVVEADPRYEQQNIIGRIVEPERVVMFRAPTRAVCASIPLLTCPSSSSWALSRFSRTL